MQFTLYFIVRGKNVILVLIISKSIIYVNSINIKIVIQDLHFLLLILIYSKISND